MTDLQNGLPPAERLSSRNIQSVCLMVLAGVAIVYMVYWLRPVLVPFVVACFIVSGVGPILLWLERKLRVSRLVAAVLAFLVGIAILALFGLTIWTSMVDLVSNASAYRQRVQQLVKQFEESFSLDPLFGEATRDHDVSTNLQADATTSEPDRMDAEENSESIRESHIDPSLDAISGQDDVAADLPPLAIAKNSPSKRQLPEHATQFVDSFVRDGITAISQLMVNLVSTSVIVLIYVFFLFLGNPSNSRSGTLGEIDRQIRNYLSLKTVISLFTGLAFGTTLWLFGVPMALSFGVLAFLLNFIPNIGPIVASLLPIPLIIFAPGGTIVWMIAVIGLTNGIQIVSGNIVEPRVMGKSSDLHPVIILLALMFWGMMWGITGMFLATPITAAIKIVLERFEPTAPLAKLLAGRWEDFSGFPTSDSQAG